MEVAENGFLSPPKTEMLGFMGWLFSGEAKVSEEKLSL